MIATPSTKLSILNLELDRLSEEKATGEIILHNQHKEICKIHLFSGRLLYVIDEHQRRRRFFRALKKNCPNWQVSVNQFPENPPWEYQLLYKGISSKELSVAQVRAVVATVAEECFFEVFNHLKYEIDWKPKNQINTELSLYLTLSLQDIHTVLNKAEQMYKHWHDAGFAVYNPRSTPILVNKIENQSISGLLKYLNGQYSLWDIALELDKSIIEVTNYLIPLIKKGYVQLQEIADLSPQTQQKTVAPTASLTSSGVQKKGLIACIDDSPVVAHNIKKILMQVGYEVISIPEPMHGFGQLIENKPDLIFLDLNMPNANGYSVCQFLRNTPAFKKTPIIIHTAHDTIIDRSRAKLVGATDFLGKPAKPEELLEICRTYLG